MAEKKKQEPKIILEREYIIPLRRKWLKVPDYKRANKASKALKEFLARHMKVYDRDLRKIKIDLALNNELRFRGIKKPPVKIKVLAKKFDDGTVRAELVNIPEHIKFRKLREEKKKSEIKKKVEKKKEEKITAEKSAEEKPSEEETKEKEEAAKEESLKISEQQAKQQKHISKEKKVIEHRKSLSR